jgi:hypothetical protein
MLIHYHVLALLERDVLALLERERFFHMMRAGDN